jgi:hypothetical protein
VVYIARKYLGTFLWGILHPPPRIQRVKIVMILRYKYTVNLKAKKTLKLRVDRPMTGIIYERLFTRKTLLSNKLYNILSSNIHL